MSKIDSNAMMLDPDQASRRLELTAFFGPNAADFLKTYDLLRERAVAIAAGQKPGFTLRGTGFEPAAFFLGPVWFFYRKLWAWAWSIVALIVVLGLLPGNTRFGVGLGAGLAIAARSAYVNHAIAKLAKLRNPQGEIDLQQAALAGGVSKTAGWISGTIFVLLTILGLAAIFLLVRSGEPIR